MPTNPAWMVMQTIYNIILNTEPNSNNVQYSPRVNLIS